MKTILVADSDAFQRQLVDMLLVVDDYNLVGFETGRQALEYLQSHVPDLAILDYSLPDINGADLCAKIRGVKRLAKVPVILIAAPHKMTLVKGIATAVKANLVLAKPLGDKKLREQVKRLIKPSSDPAKLHNAVPLNLDPTLEHVLDQLPYLTQSHESLETLQTTSQTTYANQDTLPESLPPFDLADLIDTQELQEPPSQHSDYEPKEQQSHTEFSPLATFDEGLNLGTISEQELLDSLRMRLDEPFIHAETSSFDHEPQTYRLADLESPATAEAISAPHLKASQQTPMEVEDLREQVQQLSSENEQLKATLREIDSGHPLQVSHSYLNAIEELEMLRRLTSIQTKQLNELQQHNQSMLEEIQLLKSQRRGGFLGFRSNKKPNHDPV